MFCNESYSLTPQHFLSCLVYINTCDCVIVWPAQDQGRLPYMRYVLGSFKSWIHVSRSWIAIGRLAEHDRDWSDYAIWWPKKNKWLMRMRSTLDQYDIQAGTLLHFLPVHSYLYVQLPDLQIIQMRVDFSADLFSVVIRMCRELGEIDGWMVRWMDGWVGGCDGWMGGWTDGWMPGWAYCPVCRSCLNDVLFNSKLDGANSSTSVLYTLCLSSCRRWEDEYLYSCDHVRVHVL